MKNGSILRCFLNLFSYHTMQHLLLQIAYSVSLCTVHVFYAIWFLHLRHKSDYPTNTSAVLLYVMHPKMHVNENRLYLFVGWVGKYHSVSTVIIYLFILIKVRNISRKRKSSDKSPWNLCLTNHSSLTLILLSQRT